MKLRMGCILLCALFASACTSVPPEYGTAIDAIEEALTPETAMEPLGKLPDEVSSSLIPTIDFESLEHATLAEHRFDVIVDEVPTRDFFLGLVRDTDYNIIVHPDVSGTVTLHLTNMTVPEVLEVVRDQYGYEYEITDYGYKILPSSLRTEIFHINYLNIVRHGHSEIRVSSGQVTDIANANGQSNGTGTTPVEVNKTVGTRIQTESKTFFWESLAETLQYIIGNGEGRVVVANPNSGIILVRALPAELRGVREYLDKTQLSVQRQVLIEAKILEVELNDAYKAGIDWEQVIKLGGGKQITLGQSREAFELDDIGERLGGIFSANFELDEFNSLIELLETQGNVQVLSSPQISTINNQKAVIRVGTDEFFVTDISFEEDDDDEDNSEKTDVTLTPFFSGIALDVTPQISEDSHILLHVHPTVSEVKDNTKTITIRNEDLVLPLAMSTIRESDSVIRAKNGEVVVIGGLIQNSTREEIGEAPWLGDIPYLGGLFRQTQQRYFKSELVILLRPYVVEGDTFNNAMDRSRHRVQELKRGFHFGSNRKIMGDVGEKEGY